MPRNKGSKNKPKSDDVLIEQLKARGYVISKDEGTPASEDDDEPTPAAPRIDITIDKPKIQTPEQQQQQQNTEQILRCGNKLCNKVLDKEYSVCPNCGVNLSWQ